ncbi:type IV toxin-antitoxin system AbiEi family antitoxin [Desulfobulbus alkaliphilus]|uniref:type IV toxin-antitoxin system AbiEi family antitoxin n=1 Tax=Desulfobulbus alkaliphilus TaxID=869814 RepID=UPI0019635813|nr:type IV toxin-antitoxin system AbiEi family antitoxin [Desulfobulbus alkaliphilus]MBM9538475.1 hypothetical protein [Desulfobulbus alkaliphilus]
MNTGNNEHNREGGIAILRQAMEALAELVRLEYVVEPICNYGEGQYDCIIRVKIVEMELRWCVEVKNRLTKAIELQALLWKDNAKHPLLLATKYVPPQAAVRLKENGIQFVDTVGNAFIDQPPLFIFVKGNRPTRDETIAPVARLFKGVGLKIVYLLLWRPELADWPYRELAETAGVALGTVNATVTELIKKGFILNMGKNGKKLLDRKALFERWVAAYPDNLKPKLLLGRFRGDADWWKDVELNPDCAQWGGEVAAAKLTGYLKPGTVTLYADRKRLADLVIANRLKKDPHGNVEIVERFWPLGKGFGEGDTVHPILVYADLVELGEQRTMETARMIYEQHLDRHFG